MPTIKINDGIESYYKDPMDEVITVLHTTGDTYANSTSCGDSLIQLHKDLQRLDFPYFFVKIITTNREILSELKELHSLYSNEDKPLKFEIVNGDFKKTLYKGDTSCVYPWIHKYVNPQGLVMPCCVADENYPLGNINNQNLNDVSTKKVRQQMLQGERPSACSTCWKKEDSGLTSLRQTANNTFKKYKNQKEFILRHLDIRLSNKCNLMCRICSGKFSNRIANEEYKLYGSTKYLNESLPSDLIETQLNYIENNIDTIESVYFAGGEPLINTEHYRILEIFIKHKKYDVQLTYNTNFSSLKFKKYDILDLWKKFNNVELGASIDSIGDQSQYVRPGVDYNTLEKNYNLIKDENNINFKITSVLHLTNILNLTKLQNRWIDIGVTCENISFNVLVDPPEQSITVLPYHYKKIAKQNIRDHIKYLNGIDNSSELIKQWNEAETYMMSQDNSFLLNEFFRLTDDKDFARKQKFEEYFPEYKNLRNFLS